MEDVTEEEGRPPAGEERGQTMAEYAVMLAVISPAIILSVGSLGGAATTLVERAVSLIS